MLISTLATATLSVTIHVEAFLVSASKDTTEMENLVKVGFGYLDVQNLMLCFNFGII